MQQRVYERRMNNVDELKQRLIAAWDGMQQNVIDSAVDDGESDSEHVCMQRVDSSNTFYDLLLDWKNSSVTNMFKCVYLQ